MIFLTFTFLQVSNEITARHLYGEINIFKNFFKNYLFLLIICIISLIQIGAILGGSTFLGTCYLEWQEWTLCLCLAAGNLLFTFLSRCVLAVYFKFYPLSESKKLIPRVKSEYGVDIPPPIEREADNAYRDGDAQGEKDIGPTIIGTGDHGFKEHRSETHLLSQSDDDQLQKFGTTLQDRSKWRTVQSAVVLIGHYQGVQTPDFKAKGPDPDFMETWMHFRKERAAFPTKNVSNSKLSAPHFRSMLLSASDQALYSTCVGISAVLVAATGWCLFRKIRDSGGSFSLTALTNASGLGFLIVAFIANLIYLGKTLTALVYSNGDWLLPWPRYLGVYLFLNLPTVMLYFLYERRLSLLFSTKSKKIANFYTRALWLFMLAYSGVTIAIVVLRCEYAVNTSSGGYASGAPYGENLNMINYIIDMIIGVLILSGTTHALIEDVRQSSGARIETLRIYRAILGSDCLRYTIVAAIEAYKLATSVNSSIGPPNAVQHIIDTVKIAIMTFNLFAPVAIAKGITTTIAAYDGLSSHGNASKISHTSAAQTHV
ncbi:Calcium-transporting ATPase 10, plasma membrane-type [Cladochytrium tenue]|nr:Calcium-transporting ATPase 10, plasma membrane-type [Cladochytrium tenue]